MSTLTTTAPAASPVAAQLLSAVSGKLAAGMGQQAATAKAAAGAKAAELGAAAAAKGAVVATLTQVKAALTASGATPQQLAAINGQLATAGAQAAAAKTAATQAGAAVTAISVPTVATTEVTPLSKDDPRGAGLGIAALPLAMGGMIGGVLISMLVTGGSRRLVAAAVYGLVGGGLLAFVLGPWLDVLPDAFATTWVVLAAALFATGALITGLHALLGRAGIAIGAVLTMFLGNPLSGASSPVEFYPWIWGQIGQLLVPGAASTLLRNVTYFPEASTLHGWLVLAGWALLGMVLTMTGSHRAEEVVHIDGAVEPDPA